MSRWAWLALLALLACLGLLAGAAPPSAPAALAGSGLPAGFVDELVVNGLNQPTAMDWSGDGRLFIAEKPGRVRVYHQGVLLDQPFIDISTQVNNFGDRGLLGLAVHPDFPAQPYVYLLFTFDPPDLPDPPTNVHDAPDGSGARVSRLILVSADPDNLNQALPGSAWVVLGQNSTLANIGAPAESSEAYSPHPPASCQAGGLPIADCLPSDGPSHSIGTVLFAPDGSLWVGSGDGSDWHAADPRALRAQDLDSLAGKIMRIDPETGLGYPDNPFFDGDPASNRSRVLSYGLRNPFRFSLDPASGQLYVGDVGWGGREEINRGIGQNFGWPCYEGFYKQNVYSADAATSPDCRRLYERGPSAVTLPLYDYARDPILGAALVLGEVYSGSQFPAAYHGALFFTDFNLRWLRVMTFDGQGNASVQPFADVLTPPHGVPQLRTGPDGSLYYLHFAPFANASQVRRLRYAAVGSHAPAAQLRAAPTHGEAPLSVHFSAAGTTHAQAALFDTSALTFTWSFGNGVTASGLSVTHTYTQPGAYTAVLTVTDALSVTTRQTTIHAGNTPPVVTITAPLSGAVYTVGESLAFAGAAHDAQDGPLPPDSLAWSARLHANAQAQPLALTASSGVSGSLTLADHGDSAWLELCLTATDDDGLAATACTAVLPRKSAYTFQTDPPGLWLIYQNASYRAPFTLLASVNATRTLSAPQSSGVFVFHSWADEGPPTRTLVIAEEPMTVTGVFKPNQLWLPLIGR